jgi:hypothetical protein
MKHPQCLMMTWVKNRSIINPILFHQIVVSKSSSRSASKIRGCQNSFGIKSINELVIVNCDDMHADELFHRKEMF